MTKLGSSMNCGNIATLTVVACIDSRRYFYLGNNFRRHRARKRTNAHLKRLERKARRQKKYERYLNALAALRGAGDGRSEQVSVRQKGRNTARQVCLATAERKVRSDKDVVCEDAKANIMYTSGRCSMQWFKAQQKFSYNAVNL